MISTKDTLAIADDIAKDYGLYGGDIIAIVNRFTKACDKRANEISKQYQQLCIVQGCNNPTVPLSCHCIDHIFSA